MPSKPSTSHSSNKPSDPSPNGEPNPKKPNPDSNPSNPKAPKPDPSTIPKSPKKKSKPSDSMSKESDSNSQRKRKAGDFGDDETIPLLNGIIEFRSKTGGTPTQGNMKFFFDSVKDSLHSQHINQDQLYNKLRNLRRRFYKMAETGVGPTLYDQTVYELSIKAWGPEGLKKKKKPNEVLTENGGSERIKEEGGDDEDGDEKMYELEDEDAGDSFKYLNHEAKEYWKLMGLPVESLELGLKSMDKSKGKALEKKWRQHLEVDLKLRGKQFDLNKDFYAALFAARRGMNT